MAQITQRSFTSGEITPAIQARADTVKYATGLNLCENFLVRAQGGVYSRPGFRFIGELDDSSKQARLIDFSFNTEQTYILVFEHLKMRVIRDGGYVLAGGGPAIFELVTPYTEAQLQRLSYTQSADVMTIAHPDHDPSDLSRLADDNWALDIINYASTLSPPTFPSDVVRNISGITNANPANVTSNGHGFSTGNTLGIAAVVGMTQVNNRSFIITALGGNNFQLNGEDSSGYGVYVSGGTATRTGGITTIGSGFGTFDKTYTYVVTAVDVDGIESLVSSTVSLTTKSLSVTGGIRLNWNAVVGAKYYRVYKDPSNNTDIFGWIGDSNNLTFDDFNLLPITSDAPPEDRQPFNGAGNKPSVVNYYQQRQIFSTTKNEPQVTYTTQVGNYKSLRTSNPARADDAVTFTIAASQVNEIRHIVSLDSLILLTSGGEWLVSEGSDQVLTPSTIGVRIQSYNGSSFVKPVIINSTVLYLQEKSSRIRDLGYEFSNDKYTGNDLSLMSEHLFENNTIIDMAYADEPYGILWCVRDDGILLGLTYKREHQVWGWHHHVTNGDFESVTTISENGRDAVYVIVRRIINGVTKRYVERLEHRETNIVDNSFYVDSGLSYNGLTASVVGATQTNPVVISTDIAHNYVNNDVVRFKDILGMTELNGNDYTVANTTPTTFELLNADGTLFTAYIEGGIASKLTSVVSGLDHLEGEIVTILADGNVEDDQTVISGSITLMRPAATVHVGLQYIPVIELLDIDTPSPQQSLKPLSVSVSKVFIEFEKSRGGFVGARRDITSGQNTTYQEIKPRFDSDNYDPIALRTFTQEVSIDPSWNKGGGVRIEQRAPLPMTILSVTPRVDIGGS